MLALRLPVFATATLLFFTALIPSARAEPETSPPEASAVPAAPAPSSAEEWERSYDKARTAMRDGFFTAAAAAMTKLAEQAPDATRKRVALEASWLAIYWSRRAYVLRTEPSSRTADAASASRSKRAIDELAILYTSSVLYGLGSGLTLAVLTEPESAAAGILPALALSALAAGGVQDR